VGGASPCVARREVSLGPSGAWRGVEVWGIMTGGMIELRDEREGLSIVERSIWEDVMLVEIERREIWLRTFKMLCAPVCGRPWVEWVVFFWIRPSQLFEWDDIRVSRECSGERTM
jgi:hypothetical protein